MSDTKIERHGLDAAGRQVSEGYYATGPRGLILVPPQGGLKPGYRLATQAEVDAGPARFAELDEIEIPKE